MFRDTKGTFHPKMGSIKDRNGMDLTEAEDIKKRWQEYTEAAGAGFGSSLAHVFTPPLCRGLFPLKLLRFSTRSPRPLPAFFSPGDFTAPTGHQFRGGSWYDRNDTGSSNSLLRECRPGKWAFYDELLLQEQACRSSHTPRREDAD